MKNTILIANMILVLNLHSQNHIDESIWAYLSPCENYKCIDSSRIQIRIRHTLFNTHENKFQTQSDIACTWIKTGHYQTRNLKGFSIFRQNRYWIFSKDCKVWASDKTGSLKQEQNYQKHNVFIMHSELENGDSAVYTYHYLLNGKDSICFFAYKQVFKDKLLMEEWRKYVPMEGLDFKIGKSSIQKFSYDENKVKKLDYYHADSNGIIKHSQFYSIMDYNADGQLLSRNTYKTNSPDGPSNSLIYFYQNQRLVRVEAYTESKLIELTEFITLN